MQDIPQKILHICFADRQGGASIAAYRHNESLNRAGYDSKMLVKKKVSKDKDIYVFYEYLNLSTRIKNKIKTLLKSKKNTSPKPFGTWSYGDKGDNVTVHPLVKNADVIFLHWVNLGFMSIKSVEELLATGKRVIWFLHDMWPMTGGCHHSFECSRYQDTCGKCPLLFDGKGSDNPEDITYQLIQKKLRSWNRYPNLEILAPSEWLAERAKKSTLFQDRTINVYRNVLDTDFFKPISKTAAREVLDLPQSKKLILFGADNFSSPYKGWKYLKETIQNIDNNDIEFVVFGTANDNEELETIKEKVHFTGPLNDELSLRMLYNACDVFVTSSIAENYPNVIAESLACGLPCVGFNIGGIPEMIVHKKTGYISNEISGKGLLDGINWILEQPIEIRKRAREWAEDNISYSKITSGLKKIFVG